MYEDWELTAQQGDAPIRAGDISAAIRAADDANWELDQDEIRFDEPFDPFADDAE